LRFEEEQYFTTNCHNQILQDLKDRVKSIEQTIDNIILDLYGKSEMRLFDDLTYELKLDYLKRQSEELEELKDTRMRLEGVTLSYDILQSKAFLKIKDIFEEVHKEVELLSDPELLPKK